MSWNGSSWFGPSWFAPAWFPGTLAGAPPVIPGQPTVGGRRIRLTDGGAILFEDAAGLSMALTTPTGMVAPFALALPPNAGTPGQVLTTDGSGNLSWTSVGSGTVAGGGNSDRIARWTSPNVIGDSLIKDNGTNVGIGSLADPFTLLDIEVEALSPYVRGGLAISGGRLNGILLRLEGADPRGVVGAAITLDSSRPAVFITKSDSAGTGIDGAITIVNAAGSPALDIPSSVGIAVKVSRESGTDPVIQSTMLNGSGAAGFFLSEGLTGAAIDARADNVAGAAHGVQTRVDGLGDALTATSGALGRAGVFLKTGSGSKNCVFVDDTGSGNALGAIQRGNGRAADFQKTAADAAHIVRILGSMPTQTGNYIETNAGEGIGGQSVGAHLSPSGVWTDASCYSHLKEDISPVDTQEVLARLPEMRISRFYDRADARHGEMRRRRFGPFQEDMVRLFGLSSHGVSAVEIAGVALAAVKGLHERLTALEERERAAG